MSKVKFAILVVSFLTMVSCKEEKKSEDQQLLKDSSSATSQVPAEAKPAPTQIAFEENEHDFGKIKEGEIVEHTFSFTNTGNNPLVVRDARASCGCTIPEWTKEPIQPGKDGKITVKYNSSGKEGAIKKTVSVFANTEPEETLLTITADVKKLDASNGPFKK